MSLLCISHTHTHTRLMALCPGLPGWAGTRKVELIWVLLKQETVSGSGINWAICNSASSSRQITTPAPHHSVCTGRMPFLLPNQQCQSTEGFFMHITNYLRTAQSYNCGSLVWYKCGALPFCFIFCCLVMQSEELERINFCRAAWTVLIWPCLKLLWGVFATQQFVVSDFYFQHSVDSVPSVLWRCWLGTRKGIRPVKNWVVGRWHGYLSGAQCRLAYFVAADATATHYLLLQ